MFSFYENILIEWGPSEETIWLTLPGGRLLTGAAGQKLMDPDSVPEGIRPGEIQPLGNYAVQITWEDGFNQVAPFDLLETLERLPKPDGFNPDAPSATTAAANEQQQQQQQQQQQKQNVLSSEAGQILASAMAFQPSGTGGQQ